MTKLPQDFGFQTWIQMYKHFEVNMADIRRHKSIVFKKYESGQDYVNGKITTRKITLATIERNCWKEVKDCLLTDNDKHKLMDAVYGSTMSFDTEFMKRITRLINTI